MIWKLLPRRSRSTISTKRVYGPELEQLESRDVPAPLINLLGYTPSTMPAGGAGTTLVTPAGRSDDGSSPAVALGFNIDFYGIQTNTVFVNTNGNISFNQALSTFTPFSNLTGERIIAPFMADVDTRNPQSGIVNYGPGFWFDCNRAFMVNYVNVGYFGSNADKLNSFQLILIDRNDTGAGNFDFIFNYNTIQWETGDASGGTNGFGGVSALVGYSNGVAPPSPIPGSPTFEMPGSRVPGSFLDTNPVSGLIYTSNVGIPGRWVFSVRGGQVGGVGTTAASLFATAADAGGAPHVRVFNSAGFVQGSFFAYDPSFRGGVRIAIADVNGDGVNDIITAPGPGGGPHIKVINGALLHLVQPNGVISPAAVISSFMAYSPNFTGGVFVAAGDLNRDRTMNIVTGADAGGGPHVKAFVGQTGQPFLSFFAYNPLFRGGVRVAVGDVTANCLPDIITAAGPGGGPHVRVFNSFGVQVPGPIGSFFAYHPSFTGGVYVAVADVDGGTSGMFGQANTGLDIIVGAGAGGGPHVRVIDGASARVIRDFMASPAGAIFHDDGAPFRSGVRVAGLDRNNDFMADILVSFGPAHDPNVLTFDSRTLRQIDNFFAYHPTFRGGVFVAASR
ncbi:MAG: nidogen-like domain-containing protein [Gemmataceae bacterium]